MLLRVLPLLQKFQIFKNSINAVANWTEHNNSITKQNNLVGRDTESTADVSECGEKTEGCRGGVQVAAKNAATTAVSTSELARDGAVFKQLAGLSPGFVIVSRTFEIINKSESSVELGNRVRMGGGCLPCESGGGVQAMSDMFAEIF